MKALHRFSFSEVMYRQEKLSAYRYFAGLSIFNLMPNLLQNYLVYIMLGERIYSIYAVCTHTQKVLNIILNAGSVMQ